MADKLFALALSAVWLLAGTALAQPPIQEPAFAIEIPGTKAYPAQFMPIRERLRTQLFDLGWLTASDPSSKLPSMLSMEYRIAGDTVSVTVTAYYDKFDRQGAPVSPETLTHETVGTYSGKLNDRLVLEGLQRLGFEPVTIKIVSAQSDPPYLPPTRSNAPSLLFEYASLDREHGTATFRNLSSKAVDALRIGTSDEPGAAPSQGVSKGGNCALIAPGASFHMLVAVPRSEKRVNEATVEDPKPSYLTLQSVIFADGSYEGDMLAAADMAATELGADLQTQRIQSMAEPILANSGLDNLTQIARIREGASALADTPDAQTAEEFRNRFPNLSEEEFLNSQRRIGDGMKFAKTILKHELQHLETVQSTNTRGLPLSVWWNGSRKCH